jgi:tetratricopeptide (TPR) repeat protein
MPVTRITLALAVAGAAAAYAVSGSTPPVPAYDAARFTLPSFEMARADRDPLYTGSLTTGRRTYLAQASGSEPASEPAVPEPAADAPAANAPTPDLTALRYFTREGNQRRVDAEIARLKLLYPGWTPPEDLNAPQQAGDPELDRIWQLYAAGKYAEARGAVAARRAADPKWTPPADLTARLNEAEARERLINASDAKQWETVLSVAAEAPALLTCNDVDSLWRVGEAFARTNRTDRARDAYQYVLKNCDDTGARLATLQKGLTFLDTPQVDSLLALERKGPDGKGEFESVRVDIVRAHVGLAAEKSQTASDADVTALEGFARSGTSADDPLVLGWYYLRQKVPLKALDWFKLATSRADTPKAAEGLVLTLSALGRNQEAEPSAYAARDKSEDNLKAYRIVATALLATDPPPQLTAQVITRTAEELGRAREASGAQALGWYAYNTNQIGTAIQWFSTALSWDPNDEPSAYGLALSLQNQKQTAGFNQVVAQWRGRSERIATLGDPRRAANPPPRTVNAAPTAMPQGSYTYNAAPVAALPPAPIAVPAPPVAVADAGSGVDASVARASAAYRAEQAPVVSYQAPAAAPPRVISPPPAPARTVVREERVVERPARAMLDDFSEPTPRRASRVTAVAETSARATPRSGCGNAASPAGAVARGWCLMELNRPMEAIRAFDIGIQTGDGKVREDAAYGKSLANLRAGLTNDAAISATEAAQSPRRAVELTAEILTQRALAAYRDDKYAEAIVALDERARYVPEITDLMVVRGYAYYNLHRYADAERVFNAVAKTGNSAGARGLVAIGEVTGRIKD